MNGNGLFETIGKNINERQSATNHAGLIRERNGSTEISFGLYTNKAIKPYMIRACPKNGRRQMVQTGARVQATTNEKLRKTEV